MCHRQERELRGLHASLLAETFITAGCSEYHMPLTGRGPISPILSFSSQNLIFVFEGNQLFQANCLIINQRVCPETDKRNVSHENQNKQHSCSQRVRSDTRLTSSGPPAPPTIPEQRMPAKNRDSGLLYSGQVKIWSTSWRYKSLLQEKPTPLFPRSRIMQLTANSWKVCPFAANAYCLSTSAGTCQTNIRQSLNPRNN